MEGMGIGNAEQCIWSLSVHSTGRAAPSPLTSTLVGLCSTCDNVSDIGVGFLAEGCPALSKLDVSFCDRISDSAMAHIATGLSHLHQLSLSSCQITDAGVARIAKDLVTLETLNIGQCIKLTDKTASTIANQIKSLRSVDLYGCTKISAEGLKVLNKCENLKVVNLGLWHPF